MAVAEIMGGIASIASPLASYFGQKSANKTNLELAKQGREHDVNMWNQQNAYNTPSMQMQRLKEAGLNPNLIYGSGNASAGNADAAKQAQVPTVSNEMASFAQASMIPTLSLYNDWQVKKAQIANINAETQSKVYDNEIKSHIIPFAEGNAQLQSHTLAGRAELLRAQSRTANQSYKELLNTESPRTQLHQSRLNESNERVNYLRQTTKQKMIQNEMEEKFKQYGVTTSDNLLLRLLAPIIGKSASGMNDFMESPLNHFKKTFKYK